MTYSLSRVERSYDYYDRVAPGVLRKHRFPRQTLKKRQKVKLSERMLKANLRSERAYNQHLILWLKKLSKICELMLDKPDTPAEARAVYENVLMLILTERPEIKTYEPFRRLI